MIAFRHPFLYLQHDTGQCTTGAWHWSYQNAIVFPAFFLNLRPTIRELKEALSAEQKGALFKALFNIIATSKLGTWRTTENPTALTIEPFRRLILSAAC